MVIQVQSQYVVYEEKYMWYIGKVREGEMADCPESQDQDLPFILYSKDKLPQYTVTKPFPYPLTPKLT